MVEPTDDRVDAPEQAEAEPAKPRRRRRWLRVLIVVLVVLALLVGLAPYLLSTGPGTSMIVAIANAELRGRLEIDDLSLSWGSPTRVTGLRLYDPQDRLVAETDEITADLGVWAAIMHPEAFGQVAVRSTRLTLYETADGSFSIVDALPETSERQRKKKRKPRDPREPSPEPHGRVLLENASVEIVRLDGRRLNVIDIQTTLDIESSAKMNGRSSFALASGGRFETVYDLDRMNARDPLKHRIQARLATPQRFDLGPIFLFATGHENVAGELSIDGQIANDQPNGSANLAIRVHQLRADVAGRNVQPLDIALDVNGEARNKNVTGVVKLETPAGGANLTLQLADPAAWKEITGEALADAVIDGKPISLPLTTVEGTADIDLPRIAQALPGLLKLPGNAELTGGKLASSFHLTTGAPAAEAAAPAEPLAVNGTFNVTGVTLVRENPPAGQAKQITWPPANATFNAAIVTGTGLTFRETNLDAGFATASATGTARDFDARANVDLAAAWEQAATVVDLAHKHLAGSVEATTTVDAADTSQIAANIAATAADLRYRDAEQDVRIEAVQLTLPVTVARTDGKLKEIAWRDASLVVDRKSTVTTVGAYDAAGETLAAKLNIDRQQLGPLVALAQTFGADIAGNVAGLLTVNVDANVPTGETGQLKATYSLAVNDLNMRQPERTVTMTSFSLADGDVAYEHERLHQRRSPEDRHARQSRRRSRRNARLTNPHRPGDEWPGGRPDRPAVDGANNRRQVHREGFADRQRRENRSLRDGRSRPQGHHGHGGQAHPHRHDDVRLAAAERATDGREHHCPVRHQAAAGPARRLPGPMGQHHGTALRGQAVAE
jgi:hypothetical protein